MFGDEGDSELDKSNDCVVEILTQAEFECFSEKFLNPGGAVGSSCHVASFDVAGGEIVWQESVCRKCEGAGSVKSEGNLVVKNRIRERYSNFVKGKKGVEKS